MAYLITRPRSPFWFLRSRCQKTGAWQTLSLKLRRDCPKETQEAQRARARAEKQEGNVAHISGNFSVWVPTFIAQNYVNQHTRSRMSHVWTAICMFMRIQKIVHPRQVRYEHAQDYMRWRVKGGAAHNTARLEVKAWASILNEAMRRDLCEKNVLALARIPKGNRLIARSLEHGEFKKARALFAESEAKSSNRAQAVWMSVVLEICGHIGCRFSEASIPMERVDFANREITVEDSKRKPNDPRKLYVTPIPDELMPTLEKLRDSGATRTCEVLTREMNHRFNKALKKAIGVTSRTLRVSFITRCIESGLTEQETMLLVNHSNKEVSALYARHRLDRSRSIVRKVPPPT